MFCCCLLSLEGMKKEKRRKMTHAKSHTLNTEKGRPRKKERRKKRKKRKKWTEMTTTQRDDNDVLLLRHYVCREVESLSQQTPSWDTHKLEISIHLLLGIFISELDMSITCFLLFQPAQGESSKERKKKERRKKKIHVSNTKSITSQN